MITPDEIKKLVELRNAKIIAEEQYQNYLKELIPKVKKSVINTSPLYIEHENNTYIFVMDSYNGKVIFKKVPQMKMQNIG